jgi:hypothetical protein
MKNKVHPIIRKIKKRFLDIGYESEYAEALAYKTYCTQNTRAKTELCENVQTKLPSSGGRVNLRYAKNLPFALAYIEPTHTIIMIAQLSPEEQTMVRSLMPNISEADTLFNIRDKFIIKGKVTPQEINKYLEKQNLKVAYTYLM